MSQTQINGALQIKPGSIPWAAMASGAIVPTSSLVAGALFIQSTGTVSMAASLNMGSNTIIGGAPPVNATDFATKSYVDASVGGFTIHGAEVVSVANIAALTGLPTIDGVTLVAGNVALLVGQTTASQMGPWVVSAGAWTRPSWWASASTIPEGNYFLIDANGTTYKNTKWWVTNTGNIVVDTTPLTFTMDQSGVNYVNGNGLNLSALSFSVNPAPNSGIAVTGTGVAAIGNAAALISVNGGGIGITAASAPAQVILGNASNAPTWTALSGDVTIGPTGVTTVNNISGAGFLKYTAFIANESPAGTVNGTNAAFTLANTPQFLQLYLNGVILEAGSGNDYTIAGTSITMLLVPATGDKLRAYYTH